ncbi:Mis6-domain-containing protein [Annulohypoxylon truncatum]|uniref:Mis6-domain-containing protein n=1 Tax=Annulohypoxylon truncatum TaxID=327061 RepID=UPI0020081090|nr:Mis6-domain-containing protein [Annulohypoxylon truncatum]KAI1214986.1 Mis6-domain-containing protein [Annulohypoxylon truncatum]
MSGYHDDEELQGMQDLRDTLSDVVAASKLTAKQRGSSVKPDVEKLALLSYEQGLLPEDLSQLIDLLTTPSYLDQASLGNILRNLYPAAAVNADFVVRIIGSLGHGKLKPSLAIQGALLKWLVMIYHVIDNQNILSRTYSVLFNLLDTAAIRKQLCHLLALITRRRHVRPYRIQSLLSLSRQTGNDPAVTGLLRVFKDYYPEIIVGEVTRAKASTFKHPDPQWRERLDEIQQAHAARTADRSERPLEAFRVARNRTHGKGSTQLPEVHTSNATENSITLEEIENVDGFVNNLERIELPNQLIAVLGDPLLQKLLTLKPHSEAHQRASSWLASYGQDLMSGEGAVDTNDCLEMLKSYASSTRTFPPIFLAFFNEYLKIWNGHDGRDLVLAILSYLPLLSFSELSTGILQPLEVKILDNTTDSQLHLLQFYTTLLRRWTICLASLEQKSSQASDIIADLVTHVNDLCLTLVQTSPTASTHSKVLDFYEQTSVLASDPKLLLHTRIMIPPSPLVYILHFSFAPSTLARLCSILSKYKAGFQKAMATSRSAYTSEYINEFNGFLMDICNCIWRSRAFNNSDVNAHGCLVSRSLTDDFMSYVNNLNMGTSLSSLFSLSYSPVLCLSAISHFRELEDEELRQNEGELSTRHAGPVTRASLNALASRGGLRVGWDDYRLGVLSYLERQSMAGVGELMYNTMTNVMKRRSMMAETA